MVYQKKFTKMSLELTITEEISLYHSKLSSYCNSKSKIVPQKYDGLTLRVPIVQFFIQFVGKEFLREKTGTITNCKN